MTYAVTIHGDRAHIWNPEAKRQERALCGVLASIPYSASESDIREAESNLCRRCEQIKRKRYQEMGHL